ncbi:MAG: hypothetical protein ABIC95_07060 [archaeon]
MVTVGKENKQDVGFLPKDELFMIEGDAKRVEDTLRSLARRMSQDAAVLVIDGAGMFDDHIPRDIKNRIHVVTPHSPENLIGLLGDLDQVIPLNKIGGLVMTPLPAEGDWESVQLMDDVARLTKSHRLCTVIGSIGESTTTQVTYGMPTPRYRV